MKIDNKLQYLESLKEVEINNYELVNLARKLRAEKENNVIANLKTENKNMAMCDKDLEYYLEDYDEYIKRLDEYFLESKYNKNQNKRIRSYDEKLNYYIERNKILKELSQHRESKKEKIEKFNLKKISEDRRNDLKNLLVEFFNMKYFKNNSESSVDQRYYILFSPNSMQSVHITVLDVENKENAHLKTLELLESLGDIQDFYFSWPAVRLCINTDDFFLYGCEDRVVSII